MLRLLRWKPEVASRDDTPNADVTPTDPLREIGDQAARGDATAAQTLCMALGPAILRTVRSLLGAHHPDLQDVCQESVIGLLTALPRFRGECTLTHFACRIAVLTSMNARRRGALRAPAAVEVDIPDIDGDETPSPERHAEQAHRRRVLRGLLDELPMAQAEALALHIALGYTVEEAAQALGSPVNTVRSRLRRALSALRDRLHADGALLELVRGVG